jgi:hypothetical protein
VHVIDAAALRAFRIMYAVWLFGVFAYFVPASTWSPVSRLALTHAMVDRGTLSIDDWSDATGDRAKRDGHWYTDKAPVPSLIALPAYAISHAYDRMRGHRPHYTSVSTPDTPARHVTVNWTFAKSLYVCSLSTAALAGVAVTLLLFEWLRTRVAIGAAFAASLFAALATPLFPYATSFYGHAVAAALLFAAYFLLTRATRSRSAVRWAGAALILSGGSEYIVTIPALVVASYGLLREREGRAERAVDLALGAALPILAIGAYHAACFGSPLRTGYSFLPRAEFASGHARGFMGIALPDPRALGGLLFGLRRGLFALAPITIVGVAGLVADLRRKSEARLALGLFVVLLLLNAGYYMWWGGAAAGPRHLVPVLPFLGIGLGLAWERARWRPAIVVLAVVSFLQILALTAVGLEAPEHGAAVWDYAWPRLREGKIAHLSGASNLGLRIGLAAKLSLLPLILWIATGLILLRARLREL